MLALFLDLIDDPNDRDFFLSLYNKYETGLFNYAYSFLKDYHLSEDVLQDVFLKVARNIKPIREKTKEEKNIRNYLYISVKHRVYDIFRKKQQLQVATVDFLENLRDEYSSKEIDNLATRDLVARILENLDDKYSDALYLHFVMGFKEKEIADSLNININTMRQHISRGKKRFIEDYEKELNS